MAFSIKFNDIELSDIVDGFTSIQRDTGGGFTTNLQSSNGAPQTTRYGQDFLFNTVNAKTITVGYILHGNLSDWTLKRNQIASILNVKVPSPLIFGDESNKVWYAIADGNQTLTEDLTTMTATGVITFLVPSGISESTYTQTLNSANSGGENGTITKNSDGSYSALVNNQGSLETFPTVKITNSSDNGLVGLVGANGIIQLGKNEDVDVSPAPLSKVLLNCVDNNSFSYFIPTSAPHPIDSSTSVNGSLNWYLDGIRYADLGSGNNWHGGMSVAELSETSKDFYCYFNLFAWLASFSQIGDLQIMATDSNDKLIMAYGLVKSSPSSSDMLAKFWVGGDNPREYSSHSFTPDDSNDGDAMFNQSTGNADMVKEGPSLQFYWMGKRDIAIIPELENIEASKIYLFIGTYGSHDSSDMITNLSLRKLIFQKNLTAIKDVPNRYPENTELLIDMENGSISKNGIKANGEKIIGSKFFSLTPGQSELKIIPSSWFEGELGIEVTWSERYL